MQKKIFSVISIIFLTVSVIFPSLTAYAYEVTGFNISAKAGMLVAARVAAASRIAINFFIIKSPLPYFSSSYGGSSLKLL